MSSLGLLDDIRDISPRVRLLVGAAVTMVVILVTGTGFELVSSALGGVATVATDCGLPFGAHVASAIGIIGIPLSVLVGVFIVLGACNSANLIDGLDGLCSGVTAIISLGFFLLAAHLAVGNWTRPSISCGGLVRASARQYTIRMKSFVNPGSQPWAPRADDAPVYGGDNWCRSSRPGG